jgi:hypothetical protein
MWIESMLMAAMAWAGVDGNWKVSMFAASDNSKLAGQMTLTAEGDAILATIGNEKGVGRVVEGELWLVVGAGECGILVLNEDGPLLNGTITNSRGQAGDIALRKLPTTQGIYQIEATSNDDAGATTGGSLKLDAAKVKLAGALNTFLAEFGADGQTKAGVAFDAPPFKVVGYGKGNVRLMKLSIGETTLAGGFIASRNVEGSIALSK